MNKIRTNFPRRTQSELKKSDEELLDLVLADYGPQLFKAWETWGGCHLFLVGSRLFARGNKAEREFAKGFVFGWRSALRNCTNDE